MVFRNLLSFGFKIEKPEAMNKVQSTSRFGLSDSCYSRSVSTLKDRGFQLFERDIARGVLHLADRDVKNTKHYDIVT
jgi:hypothetical protein